MNNQTPREILNRCKINSQLIKYCFAGITLFFCQFTLIGQQQNIDSLLSVLKTAKEDTTKVKTLNILCKQLWLANEYNKATGCANEAMTLINKSPASLRELKRVKAMLATSLNSIGFIYWNQGDYPKALEHYFKSLKIMEEIGNKQGVGQSLNNIGIIYGLQGDYPKALEQHFRALKIKEELKDKKGIASSYNNIGTIYSSQSNYPKALEQHLMSLKIREEIGYKPDIATSLNNIGNVYILQGDYPRALDRHFKSLKIMEEIGEKDGIASSCINLGAIHTKLKNFKQASNYLNDALSLSKEIGFKEEIKDSYYGLSDLDKASGNYKQSLEHYKMYIIYRDSLLNEANTKKTVQTQMNYEFDKKEAIATTEHKSELEKQNAIAEEKSRKQKMVTWSVVVGLLFVILFAIFVFRSLRITRKQKQIIEEKNKEVEEKNKDILDSIRYAKRIQSSLLPTEKYIERIVNKKTK